MLAYRDVSFGTWSRGGTGRVLMNAADPKPRKPVPPDFEPPTLAVVPKHKPVYAIGVELPIQNPATSRRETVTAQVLQRFHMAPRNDKRRVNSALEWLYLVRVEGQGSPLLLNEAALTADHLKAKAARACQAPAAVLKTVQRETTKPAAEQSATPAA